MPIVEVRGGAETGLAVESVGVGSIDHQFIHTPAQEVKDGGIEFAVGHGSIFRGGFQSFIGSAATSPANEIGFKNSDVVAGIRGTVHQLMLLMREHPEEGSRSEGVALASNDVGDLSACHEVELEFSVMVGSDDRWIPHRLGEIEESVVVGINMEFFLHGLVKRY